MGFDDADGLDAAIKIGYADARSPYVYLMG